MMWRGLLGKIDKVSYNVEVISKSFTNGFFCLDEKLVYAEIFTY